MRIIALLGAQTVRELMRKKDFYVFFGMLCAVMFVLTRVSVFGQSDMSRFLKEAGLGLIYIFSLALAIPLTARLLITELRDKTIYPLLAKPVSRLQVVLGKYCGALLAAEGSFSVFFLFFYLMTDHATDTAIAVYAQVFWFGALMLALVCALSLFFSVFCTFSATVTLTAAVYVLMSWFGMDLVEPLWSVPPAGPALYYLLPHFEFYDIRVRLIHAWPPLSASTVAAVSLYTLVYCGLLLAAAYWGFARKWL
ncbi:MAG: ABC transporter permease [Candidatus Omnitrophica bacterium]|nr:ABC transporter permease [Candidatus Omnitrophota bacterium]